MATLHTYSERERELAIRKMIRGTTESVDDVPNGDFREIISTKEIALTIETQTEDIEVIKGKIRNIKKVITSKKGKVTAEEEMGNGYMNSKLALIEATLGKVIVTGKDAISTGSGWVFNNTTKTIVVTPTQANIIPDGRDEVLVSFYNKTSIEDDTLDVFYIVKEVHDVPGNKTTYTYLVDVNREVIDAVTNYTSDTFVLKPLLGVDLDADVEPVDMLFKQGNPDSNWNNNPAYYGKYSGDDIKKLGQGKGTVEIITENLKRYKFKAMLEFPIVDFVNPTPKLLKQIINYNTDATTHEGVVYWELKRQNGNTDISGSMPIAASSSTNTELGNLATAINAQLVVQPGNTTTITAVGSTLEVTDTENWYQDLIVVAQPTTDGESVLGSSTVVYTYKEDDVWEELTASKYVSSKNTPMAGETNLPTNLEEVTVDFTPSAATDFNQGDKIFLYVNGVEYVHIIPTDADVTDIGADVFATMVNANTDKYFVSAAFDAPTQVLTLTATKKYRLVNVEVMVDQGNNDKSLAFTVTKTTTTDAEEISENGLPFSLEKFYLGDFENKMIDFCNLATVKIDFNRELKDIPCIKRKDGIVGVDASVYTFYIDVEFVDQDAYEKFKQWLMFRDQSVVSVYGVDPYSGFAFYGKKVLVENFEEILTDTLLGRKLRLNVNDDPNSNFEFSLPQFLKSAHT